MNIIKQLTDKDGNNIYPVAYAQGGVKVDLLWTNPDGATSSWGAKTQDVSNISNYDFVYFVIRQESTSDYFITHLWKLTGDATQTKYRVQRAGTASSNNTGFRFFLLNSNGFETTACTYSGSTGNTYLIPYQVYGIKLSYIVPTTVHGLQYVEV